MEDLNERACAAAGQSELMSMYSNMFSEYNVACSQILVTDADFRSAKRRKNLRVTLEHLLSLGVVPIINENDVISTRKTPTRDENNFIFWDNDSLACLVGAEIGAELLLLLSDVDGLYERPPGPNEEPKVIPTYTSHLQFTIGNKSRVGRGGMQAKMQAALSSLERGVKVGELR